MTDKPPAPDCTCLPLNRRLMAHLLKVDEGSVHEQDCVERAVAAARVAAPSDGHTHYPVTDVTGTVFSYTHPAPVCPYCVAAPSDGPCGEKNHPGSHPCNAPKGHEPGPEQGGHYCRYEWRVAVPPDGLDEAPEWYRRGWAEGHAAALAATEQPETDE
jgi:hypothetical protein